MNDVYDGDGRLVAHGEDLLDELVVPCPRPWERRYAYGYEDGVIQALDDLCAACGCRMRVRRTGEIEITNPVPWNGAPDYVITDGTTEASEMIESMEVHLDGSHRANVVLHIGSDRMGRTVTGLVSDPESITDPLSPRYLGDDWWAVRRDRSNTDPEATARAELLRRSYYQQTVTWTWAGHPTLAPGAHVRIDVDGIRMPRGTVVQVLSKRSVVTPTLYTETVTAGVVTQPW